MGETINPKIGYLRMEDPFLSYQMENYEKL